jgi:hypothetical protein
MTILYVIHRLVFYLKHDVSKTGFCLRLQEKLTHLDPIESRTQSGDILDWTSGRRQVTELQGRCLYSYFSLHAFMFR